MKRFLTSTFITLALPAALLAQRPIDAQGHSWGTYHWARTSNPLQLQAGDNVTSNWQTAFNTAIADWDKSAVLALRVVAGTSNKRCSMVSGTLQVCNSTYGQNGWLGLASINVTGGDHITQGTAKMNDTYFNTATYNNPNEKLHVMCQEVGHVFGLGHTSEDGSSQNTCMDYFSNTGANANSTTSTHPNQHDYDLLASKYAHLDTINTALGVWNVAAQAISRVPSNQELLANAGQWGTPIHFDVNGRPDVFIRQIGGLEKIAPNHEDEGEYELTHVYWAPVDPFDGEEDNGWQPRHNDE